MATEISPSGRRRLTAKDGMWTSIDGQPGAHDVDQKMSKENINPSEGKDDAAAAVAAAVAVGPPGWQQAPPAVAAAAAAARKGGSSGDGRRASASSAAVSSSSASAAPASTSTASTNQYKDRLKAGESNVLVAVRVRPMWKREIKGTTNVVKIIDQKMVVVMDPKADSSDILRANRSRERKYVHEGEMTTRERERERRMVELERANTYTGERERAERERRR